MNSNKKIILTSIIFSIICLIFIVLIIYPLFRDIKRNSIALISQKKEIVLLENKIRDLKEFEKIYKENQQNFKKIDRLFYNPEVPTEIKKFADFLRKTALDSQIWLGEEILPPSPKVTLAADPWPSVNFQLAFQGSLSNVAKFLGKLESTPYLIEVLNLTMRKLTEKEIEDITRRVEKEGKGKIPSPGDINANLFIKVFTR